MELIKSLGGVNFDVIYDAFKEAFKDYEMQLNKGELRKMLNRRGFVPELSFAAFEDKKIVAFTFNGIGKFNNIKTAYDTGTGTIKEYRGRGLATKIFEYSIPYLKQADIKQYLLEVLQHNTKAVSVYKKLGFEVCREFNYYISKQDDLNLMPKTIDSESHIKDINLSFLETMEGFFDFNPSWQNSFEAISRNPEDFIMKGVFKNDALIAFIIFEPFSGDITQIAVNKNYRRQGIGTYLFNLVSGINKNTTIKIINTDIECESITQFLQSNKFLPQGKQFEMKKFL